MRREEKRKKDQVSKAERAETRTMNIEVVMTFLSLLTLFFLETTFYEIGERRRVELRRRVVSDRIRIGTHSWNETR